MTPTTSIRAATPWRVRVGSLLLLVCASVHSADLPIGGGDTLIAISSGRSMVGPWAKEHPHRTWQMRLLDLVGIHVSKQAAYTPNERRTGARDDFLSLFRTSWKDRPRNVGWVNQNWLGHLTLYGIDRLGGGSAIVGFKLVVTVLITAVMFWTGIALGAHPVTAALAAAWGILVSRSFLDIRPNLVSVLCVAIMFLILARWLRGRHGALGWLAPLMLVWSNVHGGFIYAVMVFCILVGAYLAQQRLAARWPHVILRITWRQYTFLFAGLAAVIAIPATFSPFGQENLFHFLHVTLGEDARLWRSLLEWLPISNPRGFGNSTPYLYLIGTAAIVLVTWLALRIVAERPGRIPHRSRSSKTDTATLPPLDLAYLAVVVVTVVMSFQSRRFIFVAAIVVAPVLASKAQEALGMVRRLRRTNTNADATEIAPKLRVAVAAVPFVAALPIALVGAITISTVYVRSPLDGVQSTVFDRMVGVTSQPIGVVQFLNANRIEGLILNQWSDGGYIALHQPVDPQTGETPCQVFIDGRCQNAYDIQHYRNYRRIMRLEASVSRNVALIDQLLNHHRVNLVLLKPATSKNVLQLLMRTGKWMPVCVSGDWILLLTPDASEHADDHVNQYHYPDEQMRSVSVGIRLCTSQSPDNRRKGLEMLMAADTGRSAPIVHAFILATGRSLNQSDEVQRFFETQRTRLSAVVYSGERFGRALQLNSLISVCDVLKQMAKTSGQPRKAMEYGREVAQHRALAVRLYHQSVGISLW